MSLERGSRFSWKNVLGYMVCYVIVACCCGAGGASLGISLVLGVPATLAILSLLTAFSDLTWVLYLGYLAWIAALAQHDYSGILAIGLVISGTAFVYRFFNREKAAALLRSGLCIFLVAFITWAAN